MAHYLFAHFTGETQQGEQVYFSVSKDGMHWTDLNGGNPVVCSEIGEKGVRDPFIIRSQIDGWFYIIATDLRIASKKGWDVAQYAGSTQMIIWRSKDLITWSQPWTFQPDISKIGCVWAPEAIYDSKREQYMVFWASMIQEDGDIEPKQKIFCAYTKDFHEFSSPIKYIEKTHHIIDTTIVEENGVYYRFSKDETTKNIQMDCGMDLQGPFQEVKADKLNELMGVEGPAAFPLIKQGQWCLLVDRFATQEGYLPLVSDDLSNGIFHIVEETEYDMGVTKKRHGSVLLLLQEEYDRLVTQL